MQLSKIEQPLVLSKEMKEAISEGRQQIKKGEYLTHEEAKKELNEWLEK